MKHKSTLLVFLLSWSLQILNAQNYNTYLVTLTKTGSGPGYKTNGKFLGYISSKDKIESWILPPCLESRKFYAEPVTGYPEMMDPVQAGFDPAGLSDAVLLNLKGNKIGYGLINCDGYFIVPPYYTLRHQSVSYKSNEINRFNFFGQKLKNGNWRAVSIDIFDPSGDVRVFSFPEKRDYTLLNPSLVLFREANGKYGLMDFHGNIRLAARYDTCILDYSYKTYPLTSTSETAMKTDYETMPYSFERDYKDNLMEISQSHAAYARSEPNDRHLVYVLKNGDSTLLASSEYITRPVLNGSVSAHWIGNTHFYLLKGKGAEFELIHCNGTAPVPAFRYAYYESIRRDTTPGVDRNWVFQKDGDYSRPFKSMTVDSVKMAEAEALMQKKREEDARKELEYAAIRKIALADQERLRNDPENYSNLLQGHYDVTEFAEHGVTFRKTGSNDVTSHYMSIVIGRKNIIYVTVKYTGIRNPWDAQYFTYDISAGFFITKTNDGYSLSSPSLHENEQVTTENKDSLRKVSGFFNPLTNEIEISFGAMNGESFSIKAMKRSN